MSVTEPRDTSDTSGRVGLVGKTLGRYRISAELGRGGMATVYRAFDPELSRDVAVKVVHVGFTGRADIEARFRREAQAVAGLKHDGIVATYDFAPGGDGEPAYIVSELVEGPTLRGLLDECGGRVVPEIAAAIAARVAAALGAAHARGIVHRDVKPDNVMIDLGAAGAGRPVRVLLTDFGIARMIEDDTLTATGSILGSPAYMSPEQARGGAIGPSSDVFSLGVMLYQLSTGRAPFAGKDPLAVIAAVMAGEILRPTQVEARVSPELEAVILRCLRRVPGERYPDGTAVHAALHEIVAASALPDEAQGLRRFFGDREALLREIGRSVADRAATDARACVRRGELSRALARVNRALAYHPGHHGAEAVLALISSRRRWFRAIAAIAGLLLALGLTAAVLGRSRHRSPQPTVATIEPSPLPRPLSPPPSPSSAPSSSPSSSPSPPLPPHRRRAKQREPRPVEATAPAPSPAPIAAAPAPPAPPPPPHPAPSPPATAALTLRASHGFCSPSLDEETPALRPVYTGVSAGPHRIYCTVPGSPRVLVATYELRAGSHPNLVIVAGPDGKPTLARPGGEP